MNAPYTTPFTTQPAQPNRLFDREKSMAVIWEESKSEINDTVNDTTIDHHTSNDQSDSKDKEKNKLQKTVISDSSS